MTAGRVARRAARAIGCVVFLAACSPGAIEVVDVDPASLGTGLLAHWRFDDGTGSVLTDHSGNGLNGQILNASWIEGPPGFGGALHFNASEVSVPMFPRALPMGPWTVAGWARLHAENFNSTYLTLISTENVFHGGWQMNAGETPVTDVPPSIPIYQFGYWVGPMEGDYFVVNCACVLYDEWVHLAAVVDPMNRQMLFYRNGVYQETTVPAAGAAFPPIKEGSATLYLGRWPPNPPPDGPEIKRELTGDLDDFVVYSRALAPREIERLAREGLPTQY